MNEITGRNIDASMYGRIIDSNTFKTLQNSDFHVDCMDEISISKLESLALNCVAIICNSENVTDDLCSSSINRRCVLVVVSPDFPSSLLIKLVSSGFHHIISNHDEITARIRDSFFKISVSEDVKMFNTLLSKENIYSWTYYVSHNVFFSSKEMAAEFGIPEYISGADLETLLLPCIYLGDQFVARRLLSIVESGGSIDNSSIRLLNRHKELSWFSLSSCFDPKTNIYYGIIKNIHALKCSEEKLMLESVRNNKTKAQLNKLQKLSKVGMWKLNKDQMKFSLEDETAQILGVPNHKLLSVDALEAIVHHEDRVAFRASILAILHQQSEQAFEFRISTHLRPLLFIRMQAANKLGAVHSAIIEGTLQDISDLKIYSLELEAKNLQLQSINQNMVNHAAEIEVARRKAEESDTLKTSFLSNISHEVRTPISSIGGFAELLRSDTITKDQRERYIGLILQSNKQLLQIFTDVIELSKINSNQLSVNIEPFSVNNMLRELRDEYLPLLHAKRLQIQLETPLADNKCTILSDSNKIHRVLSAIIDNAVKFTESGTIRLSYTFHAGKLSVQVQDTGIGIPDDKLKYIFQPFRQGDETLGRGYGGIGLGLSIVDGLVKLLSGNICVKSKIGIGTTIRFTMPATLVEPESVCLADVVTSCDWSDKTLLIVEDNDINFSFFNELLSQSRVNVIHTKTIKESEEVLSARPDISAVILDFGLPDGNGADLLSHMHAAGVYRPTLIVTANNIDSVRQRCMDSMYGGILSKPFLKSVFMQKVEALLLGRMQ